MYNFCCSETCSKHVTYNELIKRWTLRDNCFTNRYCQVIIRTKICKIPYSLTPYTIMNWYRCTSHTITNILFSQFLPICNIVLLQLSISVKSSFCFISLLCLDLFLLLIHQIQDYKSSSQMIGKTFYSFYTFFPVRYVILISSQNFEQLCTCMHYKDSHSESNGFRNLEKQRINIQWVYSNPAATIRKQVSIALCCDKRFNQNIGQQRDEFISLSCLLIH